MYERQLSFFLDRIWISCRIGIWYPSPYVGSVPELASLYDPASLSCKKSCIEPLTSQRKLILSLGIDSDWSENQRLTLFSHFYVQWLPCNALRRGGYLHGSNFVNLATPTTPRHQLPGLPSNQTDFAQFEFTTVQLWSRHCKTEPLSKQTVCTVADCQGIFCGKYCNGNVVGSQGRRAIWE